VGPERFVQEISIAGRLSHPGIVPIVDSGTAGGLLYCVMPFVEGESLRARLKRDGPLPFDTIRVIVKKVAAALDAAHKAGVIHRDVKPENILLAGDTALVTDFGLARALDESGGDRITSSGIVLGTPAYMSPEQAGAGRLDHRTDIYSLAVTVHEMLVGEPPFTGPTIQAVVARHMSDMSWTKRVQHPSEIVKKGDSVDVMVLNIDIDNKRISLGLKQAEEDPWLNIGEAYPVGTALQGRVVRLMDKGVVVDLGNNLEGFAPMSQLGKENIQTPGEAVQEGQLVDCQVLEVDPIHHRIVVAVTGYPDAPIIPPPKPPADDPIDE
jgi:serine/threonine protein kinase